MIVSHLQAVLIVAQRELVEHLKSKRLLITSSLYFAFMILGLILFANIPGFRAGTGVGALQIVMFLHQFFPGFVFISLLAIILMADTISGEWKDRTLILLFTRPIARWAALAGKFVGGLAALYLVAFAGILVAMVGGMILGGFPNGSEWGDFLKGTGWLMLALAPMASFGMFLSVVFRSPTTSFIVGVLMKFVGFPIITSLSFLIELARNNLRNASSGDIVFFFSFIDPDRMVRLTGVLWEDAGDEITGFAGRSAADQFGWAAVAMLLHLGLYVGVSYLLVQKRDYP